MVVFVLDKKFVIKVMEEGGEAAMGDGWRCNGRCEGWTERSSSRGSVDGEAAMTVAEGLSEGDSDGDWSDHDQGKEVSEVDPNLLGNVLTIETDIVNHEAGNILAGSDGCRDAGNLLDESERMLEIVSPKPDRPRDSVGGQREVVGSGLVVGKGTDGVGCSRPISLRTREGDFPIVGPFNEQRCHPKDIGGVGSEVLVVGCNNTLGPVVMATTSLLVGSYNINNGKRKKEKAMLKKNAKKRGGVRGAASMSVESDPIQNSVGRIVVDENSSSNQRQHRGISSGEVGLNVFVPAEVGKEGTTCSMGRRGVAGVGGVGGSGVALIAGEGPSNSIGSPLPSGGSVDKDRSDAHHIIDIQDDLGVNFRGVIKEAWESIEITGWMGFILKERLKVLKGVIKEWKKTKFGKVEEEESRLLNDILVLDLRSESLGLVEAEHRSLYVVWSCKPKKDGGLGIRDLRWVNLSLLAKWRWKLLTEGEEVWKSVVVAKYGVGVLGRVSLEEMQFGTCCSAWWKDLYRLERGGDWFRQVVTKRMGCGDTINFWKDIWVGEQTLQQLFPRLYGISVQQDKSVREVGNWVEGVWRWDLLWRMNFVVWEEVLVRELEEAIRHMVITEMDDRRVWAPNEADGFSVKSLYVFLEGTLLPVDNLDDFERMTFKNIWKTPVPSKVCALAWQLCLDRIPTKENLVKRRIMRDEDALCSICGTMVVIPPDIMMSYGLLVGCGGNKKIRKGYSIVWLAFMWVIWQLRNDRVFNNMVGNEDDAVDSIQRLSWQCLLEVKCNVPTMGKLKHLPTVNVTKRIRFSYWKKKLWIPPLPVLRGGYAAYSSGLSSSILSLPYLFFLALFVSSDPIQFCFDYYYSDLFSQLIMFCLRLIDSVFN
ncbi:unnamed protein product [Trifolium pratense]|uniref:Uncharacterized protein n=1 Tax=Trifolium pratense TaxID=57577 RepID=A0ACB0JTY6_TRIPR|nr:unnamed protein product [Trifolium pratense]